MSYPTEIDPHNSKHQFMEDDDTSLDMLLGQELTSMLVAIKPATTVNQESNSESELDLKLHNLKISISKLIDQVYPNTDQQVILNRWQNLSRDVFSGAASDTMSWWKLQGITPIVQAYLRPDLAGGGVGTQMDKLYRGDMSQLSERERSRRLREIMNPWLTPLAKRASGEAVMDLGVNWTIPDTGQLAFHTYSWEPGAEQLQAAAFWAPYSQLVNFYPPKWQGHPQAYTHVESVKLVSWLDGERLDLVGMAFEGSGKYRTAEAKVVTTDSTELRKWWTNPNNRHPLVVFFTRADQMAHCLPKPEWLTAKIGKRSPNLTDIQQRWQDWKLLDDSGRGMTPTQWSRVYQYFNDQSAAVEPIVGEPPQLTKLTRTNTRMFWTDQLLEQLAADYLADIDHLRNNLLSDLDVAIWLRSQKDSGIMGMIRVGGCNGGEIPNPERWNLAEQGQALQNYGIWEATKLQYVTLSSYQMLRNWREYATQPAGAPWNASTQIQRLRTLVKHLPYYPLEYVLVDGLDNTDQRGPEAGLVDLIESIDLESSTLIPADQSRNEIVNMILQVLGESTVISESDHFHHYLVGTEIGNRVCCQHVSMAMQMGYQTMLGSLGVSNRTELICRFCHVHLSNREEDSFEGYGRETVRTSGELLVKTLLHMGLIDEQTAQQDLATNKSEASAATEQTYQLPESMSQLASLASNWTKHNLPTDWTMYVLWIWKRLQSAGWHGRFVANDITETLQMCDRIMRSDRIKTELPWPLLMPIEDLVESNETIRTAWSQSMPAGIRELVTALCVNSSHKEVMKTMFKLVVWVMRSWVVRIAVSSKLIQLMPHQENYDRAAQIWSGLAKLGNVSEWLSDIGQTDVVSISLNQHTVNLPVKGGKVMRWTWSLDWKNDDGCNLSLQTSSGRVNLKLWLLEGYNGFDQLQVLGGTSLPRNSEEAVIGPILREAKILPEDGAYLTQVLERWNESVRYLLSPDGMQHLAPLSQKMGRGQGWIAAIPIISSMMDTGLDLELYPLSHNYTDRTESTNSELSKVIWPPSLEPEPLYLPNYSQFINLEWRKYLLTDHGNMPVKMAHMPTDVSKGVVDMAAEPAAAKGPLMKLTDASQQLGREVENILLNLREGDDRRHKMAHQTYLEHSLLHLNHKYKGSNNDEWDGLADEAKGNIMRGIKISEVSEELTIQVSWDPIQDPVSGSLRSDLVDNLPLIEQKTDKHLWQMAILSSISWKLSKMFPDWKPFRQQPITTNSNDDHFFHQLATWAYEGEEFRNLINQELRSWTAHINLEKSLLEILREECHIRALYIRSQKHLKQQLSSNYELKQLLREMEGNPKKRRDILEKIGAVDDENIEVDDEEPEPIPEELDEDNEEPMEYGYADEVGIDEVDARDFN